MTLLCSLLHLAKPSPLYGQTDRQTEGRTDATKYIISLSSQSIIGRFLEMCH